MSAAPADPRTVVSFRDVDIVFGDRDGPKEKARLQHPIGIAYADAAIWVADSFNSKVKRVDPRSGEVKTFVASGLAEPQGLAPLGKQLLVADTNHHRVLRLAPGSKDPPAELPF